MHSSGPFVSIQLNSNRPEQIARFFDSIEATAQKPEHIEVLLHIDTSDEAMTKAMEAESARRKFALRVIDTDIVKGYGTLWKPLNTLFALTHPEVYFVLNVSDEFLFLTPGWDDLLRRYVGYYPDNIFRLRASQYRFRNYTDFWECGFAPDSIAFYTRRWLELTQDWCPCLGPDSFQQCVAFYLSTSGAPSKEQWNRDIPVLELSFSGEGAGIGLEGDAMVTRTLINNRAWFVLMSHVMQQEASRRAMRIKSHILAGRQQNAEVTEDTAQKRFLVREKETGALLETVPYALSWWRVTFTNAARMPLVRYYAGGGLRRPRDFLRSVILMSITYWRSSERLILFAVYAYRWLKRRYIAIQKRLSSIVRPLVRLFSTCRAKYLQIRRRAWVRFDPAGIASATAPVEAMTAPTVFSFHLPEMPLPALGVLLDNIEATAQHPEYSEVLVPAEADEAFLREQARRKVKLRAVGADENMLRATHSQAYFVAFMDGNTRFETQGWDMALLSYLGAFSDHIFRLRISAERFRNYTSASECAFSPDRVSFYTRRWLAIQGDTGPWGDIAAFQQCISYYLYMSEPFSHGRPYREMAVPFLRFSSAPESASIPLPRPLRREAKRRAMQLKAAMFYYACLAQLPDKPLALLDDGYGKAIVAESPGGQRIKTFSYRWPCA